MYRFGISIRREFIYSRFNDGNRYGLVNSAGQSFIDHVLKNGHRIHWEKGLYGDARDVKLLVIRYQMNIDVGAAKWRILIWIVLQRLIVVLNRV